MHPTIIPVLICGGAGTRLWPVSRESMPKQFVSLVAQESTFQQVLQRIKDPNLFARPIIITNAEFRFIVAEQLRECGAEADIILEPMRRDSAPAIAVAALLAAERDPQALVLVLAADHVIRNPDEFIAACRQASAVAAEGRIVTFGIRPTYPATNYGYIRPGAQVNGSAVLTVDAFVEKPDADTAARYVEDRYLWNSGNFLFDARAMLGEIERFEPAIAEAARAAVESRTRDLDFVRLAAEPFARAPQISIDYAVMERTGLAAVLPAEIAWSDVGSWASVWDVMERDADGNSLKGPVVALDTHNSLIRSEDSVLTAVAGLDDVIVVTTADAVLVTSRHKAEQVKTLVELLKSKNHQEAVEHRRDLSAVGILPRHRRRQPLSGQTHRRQT